jgi:tRNA-splicing ligase RtcB
MVRSYQEELEYLEKLNNYSWRIKKGFVPNMKVNYFLSTNSYKLKNIFYINIFVKGRRHFLCE